MKLETSIRELHEMFMDMAMFVETQVISHTLPAGMQNWLVWLVFDLVSLEGHYFGSHLKFKSGLQCCYGVRLKC